jgi:hypothetical protein
MDRREILNELQQIVAITDTAGSDYGVPEAAQRAKGLIQVIESWPTAFPPAPFVSDQCAERHHGDCKLGSANAPFSTLCHCACHCPAEAPQPLKEPFTAVFGRERWSGRSELCKAWDVATHRGCQDISCKCPCGHPQWGKSKQSALEAPQQPAVSLNTHMVGFGGHNLVSPNQCSCGFIFNDAYPAPAEAPQQPATTDPERCVICGWPMQSSPENGCTRGNCSYRPEQGSAEWIRIQQQIMVMRALGKYPQPDTPQQPAQVAPIPERHIDTPDDLLELLAGISSDPQIEGLSLAQKASTMALLYAAKALQQIAYQLEDIDTALEMIGGTWLAKAAQSPTSPQEPS